MPRASIPLGSCAIQIGLVFGFVGIAVFIFFIHHISQSIQANKILSRVSVETLRAVDQLFPEEGVENESNYDPDLVGQKISWHPVMAEKTGYLETIDTAGLLEFARERDSIIRMENRVGGFVINGLPIASISGKSVSEKDRCEFEHFYAIGTQRTVEQDAEFGIRQLVDVALKGLSPGINDTTTAVMCIHYLTAIQVCLAGRKIESCQKSEDGKVRLLACGPTYADLVGLSFDQIRQCASGNSFVLGTLLGSIKLLDQNANMGIDGLRRGG